MLQEASVLKTVTDSDLNGPTQVAAMGLLDSCCFAVVFFAFTGSCAYCPATQPAPVGQERTGHLQHLFS